MEPEMNESVGQPYGSQSQPEQRSTGQQNSLKQTFLNLTPSTWIKCVVISIILSVAAVFIVPEFSTAQSSQPRQAVQQPCQPEAFNSNYEYEEDMYDYSQYEDGWNNDYYDCQEDSSYDYYNECDDYGYESEYDCEDSWSEDNWYDDYESVEEDMSYDYESEENWYDDYETEENWSDDYETQEDWSYDYESENDSSDNYEYQENTYDYDYYYDD